MDVSMLHSAEDTANAAVARLDQAIDTAEQNLVDLLSSLPLADILAGIDAFLAPSGLIQTSLHDMTTTLESIRTVFRHSLRVSMVILTGYFSWWMYSSLQMSLMP